MARDYSELKLKQTEELLRPFRRVAHAQVPRGGWARAVREALGMSAAQLAARLNVTRQTIRDLEQSEATGKITVDSLNKLASAMGCRVIYALVPEKPLAEMQRERASKIADSLVKPVSHSMKLEAQSISERDEQRQKDQIVRKLLAGNPRKLWD